MKNDRLPGFTIQEMIIVLVISSLLIGMAYFTYQAIHQYYFIYKKQSEEVLELYRLIDLYEEDSKSSIHASKKHAEITFITDEKTITYYYLEEIIIRKGINSDTFFISDIFLDNYFNDSFQLGK